MLKIGDKVIFKHISNREYAWELNEGETYVIQNNALDNNGVMYYGIKKENNEQYSSWYLEEDFYSLKKLRKEKLQKINKKSEDEYLCENCIYFSVGAMCPTCDNHSKFENK